MGQGAGILPLPLPQSECWSCEFPLLIWGSTVYSCWATIWALQHHIYWYLSTVIRLLVSVRLLYTLSYDFTRSDLVITTLITIKIIAFHFIRYGYVYMSQSSRSDWFISGITFTLYWKLKWLCPHAPCRFIGFLNVIQERKWGSNTVLTWRFAPRCCCKQVALVWTVFMREPFSFWTAA